MPGVSRAPGSAHPLRPPRLACRWTPPPVPGRSPPTPPRPRGCVRCRLAETRTQVVFGSGNPDAELMLVGEAPGFHEDQGGLPFAGQAGELLERLLAGIGLARDEVYLANVLKCRPPQNRDPLEVGDRGLRAPSLPPDRARPAPGRRHARELRDEAPLRPLVRDHARARPGARGDARPRRRSILYPRLPPRRRALHAVDAEGAGGRLRPPARAARPAGARPARLAAREPRPCRTSSASSTTPSPSAPARRSARPLLSPWSSW